MSKKKERELSRREFIQKGAAAGAAVAMGALLKGEKASAREESGFIYPNQVGGLPDILATVKNRKLYDPLKVIKPTGRLILKGGYVIDPKNGVEGVCDIAIRGKLIEECRPDIKPERGDRVINLSNPDLVVAPGLIEMHLHLGDLFEVAPLRPQFEAVADGVTVALSPGAGNTLMAPALFGAEVDRGLPLNVSVYLGAACVVGARASVPEKIAFFNGTLDDETIAQKITRNPVTNTTAPLAIGIKDHMGHFILSDEDLEAIYEITSKTGLVFMSHTQDHRHTERVVNASKGRPVHLGHATCIFGSHGDPVEGMSLIVELAKRPNVTAEFVTIQLRPFRGGQDAIFISPKVQQIAYDALEKGICKVLISDGQMASTMKGAGNTSDDVGCLIELDEMGVLPLSKAIACMTINPAQMLAQKTGQDWWTKELGHLGKGARANITVMNKKSKMATMTLVNGTVASLEGRDIREAYGSGGWVTRFGILDRTGVGDLAIWGYAT